MVSIACRIGSSRADQKKTLVEWLVKKYQLRALPFPLVASEYGLSDESLSRIRAQMDRYTRSCYKKHAGEIKKASYAPIVAAYSELDRKQLRRFFVETGRLKADGELVDAADAYGELAPMMLEMLSAK